jgi:hypothetical protein
MEHSVINMSEKFNFTKRKHRRKKLVRNSLLRIELGALGV